LRRLSGNENSPLPDGRGFVGWRYVRTANVVRRRHHQTEFQRRQPGRIAHPAWEKVRRHRHSAQDVETEAYNVRDFEISGGPGWINTDRWDIEAKAEGVAGRLPLDQFKPMLRVLIEDRFQLKVHREMKEMPAYVLSMGKNGSKMQPNSGEPGPDLRGGRGQWTAKKVPMAMVAQVLSNTLRRLVIDKTGLAGEYDFTLEWAPETGQGTAVGGPPPGPAPEAPPAAEGPSIFTAIQEQLGLRLDSQKAPVETIVIDRVEKPSEN